MTEEHYFGEWVPFENEEEKQDARKYLELWKKFILKKLNIMNQIHADHWIEREFVYDMYLNTYPYQTLGLKICLTGDLPRNFGYLTPRELG